MISAARRRQVDRNLRRAFALTGDVIKNPDKYPDDFLAIPLDPDLLARTFSKERVRLLNRLRERDGFDSVKALAKSLGRDTGRVSRDMTLLEELGLVILERKGKAKRVRATKRPIILV
ncbi:MAG: hypothetical protein HY556_05885 [Euryarchaeota archaeon]|nr:hypothetical protein [Euryarchaeota archaeon]